MKKAAIIVTGLALAANAKKADFKVSLEPEDIAVNEKMMAEQIKILMDLTVLTIGETIENVLLKLSNKYIKNKEKEFNSLHETNSDGGILSYWILLQKNTKHSPQHYYKGLSKSCEKMNEAGLLSKWKILAQQSLIPKLKKTSACLARAQYVKLSGEGLDGLAYAEEVKKIDSSCILKFGGKIPKNMLRHLSQIWLNKPRILCEQAVLEPDKVTTLFDSGAGNSKSLFNNMMSHRSVIKNGTIGMQKYGNFGNRHWFGRKKCNVNPVAMGYLMSIRGRDCTNFLKAFDEALNNEIEKGCGCFDEEYVLTRVYHDHPELFTWKGTS